MYANLSVWSLAAIIILSMLIGFWAGLGGRRKEREEEMLPAAEFSTAQGDGDSGPGKGRDTGSSESRGPEQGNTRGNGRKAFHKKKEIKSMNGASSGAPTGWAIGSPAAGAVSAFQEGSRRGVLIRPEQGKLFAPISGKIIRLYPSGNAFRLRTEFGVELLLQAGTHTDELEGLHFRPRVVQNEIVGKGKLLLEFDVESIREEGYESDILMSVEDVNTYHSITLTDADRIKPGEDLMWVSR